MLVDLHIVLGMLLKFNSQNYKSDPPVQPSSDFFGYLDMILLMYIDFQMTGDVCGLSKAFFFFAISFPQYPF